MPPQPLSRVTVVLVHREQPRRCIAAARAFLEQGGNVSIMVVDNGSRPEARDAIAAALPEAEIVCLPGNFGFGPAANEGLRRWLERGDGEWVALAPHDVLPEPGCLERILDAAASRPAVGLASCEFGEDLVPVVDPYFGGIELPAERGEGWEPAGHPHGSLMLLRRGCLEEVGLFDERYFAYCEEADLAVRARGAGWDVGIVWGARVRNTHLGTPLPVIEYLKLRNSLLLVRSHFGRYRAFIRICFAVATLIRQAARPRQRPAGFSPGARVLAVRDFLSGRFGPPPDDRFPSWAVVADPEASEGSSTDGYPPEPWISPSASPSAPN